MKSAPDCVLYVATCDAYRDLWPGFFHCLWRYWPDNPFPVFVGANQATFPARDVTTLPSAPDSSWSLRLREQLGTLPSEYVLVMLDDFYLRRRVNTQRILDSLAFAKDNNAVVVRLIPRPPPQQRGGEYPFIGVSPSAHPYRVCTQASIWRRTALIELLHENENIWQFEHEAQARSTAVEGVYCAASREILPYRGLVFHHVVEKGQWIPTEYLRLRCKGVPVTRTARPLMKAGPFCLLFAAEVFNRVLTFLCGSKAHEMRERFIRLVPKAIRTAYRRHRGYPVPAG